MKKICLYLLMLSVLGTNTILREFLKTPLLVKHFIAHQHQNPAISLVTFLSMHYFGEDLQDNDQKEDMKLPFKKIGTSSHHVLFQSAVSDYYPGQQTCTIITQLVYRQKFFQNRYCDQLYRPPKLNKRQLIS